MGKRKAEAKITVIAPYLPIPSIPAQDSTEVSKCLDTPSTNFLSNNLLNLLLLLLLFYEKPPASIQGLFTEEAS